MQLLSGIYSNPGTCPWLDIILVTLQCSGGHSNHWAHLPGHNPPFRWNLKLHILDVFIFNFFYLSVHQILLILLPKYLLTWLLFFSFLLPHRMAQQFQSAWNSPVSPNFCTFSNESYVLHILFLCRQCLQPQNTFLSCRCLLPILLYSVFSHPFRNQSCLLLPPGEGHKILHLNYCTYHILLQ